MLRIANLLLLISLFSACNTKAPEQQEVMEKTVDLPEVSSPENVLNVGLLIMDGVYNTELTAPMDIFQHTIFHTDPGMRVYTVAQDLDTVTTFEGLRILPDYSFETAPAIDVLVVPSAEHHLDTDLENEKMIGWVAEVSQNADYVISLCDGAFVLARAGVLNGKVSTTFPSDISKMREMFPDLDIREGVSFVHDGKVITSAGGAKSFDPALYLSELLYGKTAADGLARGLVINWDINQIDCIIL